MDEQYDLFPAMARKREKLTLVSEHAGTWMDAALRAAADLAADHPGMVVTGETLRRHLEPMVGPPHHHNAWGAAIATLARWGVLKRTGDWVPMRGEKSNARLTPVYKLVAMLVDRA